MQPIYAGRMIQLAEKVWAAYRSRGFLDFLQSL